MIWNIVDRRKRPYRWKAITAIIEPTYHDNNCARVRRLRKARIVRMAADYGGAQPSRNAPSPVLFHDRVVLDDATNPRKVGPPR
jgi:hypothetical protein